MQAPPQNIDLASPLSCGAKLLGNFWIDIPFWIAIWIEETPKSAMGPAEVALTEPELDTTPIDASIIAKPKRARNFIVRPDEDILKLGTAVLYRQF